MTVSTLLEKIFAGSEQINVEEMQRRAVIAHLPADLVAGIGELPKGIYDRSAAEARLARGPGVDPAALSEEDLVREMESLGQRAPRPCGTGHGRRSPGTPRARTSWRTSTCDGTPSGRSPPAAPARAHARLPERILPECAST